MNKTFGSFCPAFRITLHKFKQENQDDKKKNADDLGEAKLINRAKAEVPDFEALIIRFEHSISVLGRSQKTFECYSRHVAAIALHYGKIPTLLDQEQIHEYLFLLQKRCQTPSQTYFKHTIYGLRFLLKAEGLP